MKLCKDCKHYYPTTVDCRHYKNLKMSLIDGAQRTIDSIFYLRQDQSYKQYCGTEGRWWEPL